MGAIEIRKSESLEPEDFKRVMTGYRTSCKYRVDKTETPDSTTISLQLVALDRPYVKIFPQPTQEIKRYQQIIKQGTSLGAYDEGRLVGLDC
jgi:hypothetical protein